ncbi:glycosyltransferase [Prochlorococcus sp. AH-736-L17]|nr:glycosyltransferase [Prochlorococcus sp. AH-736-L17]MDA9738440.1 glycosyltransferase [Prochlorococcus sp. AH-736-L17]
MNISLIKTRNWSRNLLNADEEENIFREAINLMDLYKIDFLIGWGNLLLEESVFKEAKKKKVKLCFYLVNPTFKGKKSYLLKNADLVITDSEATRNLYKKDLNCETLIISKSLEKKPSQNNIKIASRIPKNCLLVNPSLEKGLEPLLLLSEYFYEQKSNLSFLCVDGRNQFKKKLSYLNFNDFDIKSNLSILPAVDDIDNLFSNIRVLLLFSIWHESGSRLILEAYARGIPVIAFQTGGNKELMKNYPDDIFKKPDLYFDKNNQLRISNWDLTSIAERIKRLNIDDDFYNIYSKKIKNENTFEEINKNFIISLEEMIEKVTN